MKNLIFLLILLSSKAMALDAFYLPYTKHLEACPEECPYDSTYNEENHVMGLTNGKYSAFVMKNSYNRYSMFAGKQWNKDLRENIRTFATIGGVTGYSKVSKNILGIAAAGYIGFDFHAKNDKWGIVLTAIPHPEGMFNIGFRWKI